MEKLKHILLVDMQIPYQDLPVALQNSYKVGVEEGAASVFHFFDISNKSNEGSQHATPMKLLELKSGYLRHFKETVVNVVESANKESTKFWCEYSPTKLNHQHVMQVGDDFLEKKLKRSQPASASDLMIPRPVTFPADRRRVPPGLCIDANVVGVDPGTNRERCQCCRAV